MDAYANLFHLESKPTSISIHYLSNSYAKYTNLALLKTKHRAKDI